MQSRQPRLGDVLDDYCPRERRLTNHAVVAMLNDQVKQTRCTTCDAEHDYKHGKVPPQRKKKESTTGLYKDVLAGLTKKPGEGIPGQIVAVTAAPVVLDAPQGEETVPEPAAPPAATSEEAEDDGPVHRPLIRATLPRPEGQSPTRPAPDFTMRQPIGRPGRFRPGGANRPHRSNRPQGHSSQASGNSFRSPGGMRPGPHGHPMDRPGPMSNRGGNHPGQPHRPMRHGASAMTRSGKKRSK